METERIYKMRIAIFSSVKRMYLLYAFFCGLIIGTLFLNLVTSNYYDEIGVFSKYFVDKFNALVINKSELFSYTFLSRLKEMALVFVFSFTVISAFYNSLYCLFLGFSTGIFISSLTVTSGIKGVWFYMLSIFPHYIIYVILILFVLSKSSQINQYIYHRNTEKIMTHTNNNKNMILNIVLIIFLIITICLIEALVEVYINIPILKIILKSF